MKNVLAFMLIATTAFCLVAGCSNAQQSFSYKKVLIVYLSRTYITKVIAEIIYKNVVGTLVALELDKPYPENYQEIVAQVVDSKH